MREHESKKYEVSREISKAHEQAGLTFVTNVTKRPLDPRGIFYRLLEERYPEIGVRVEDPGVGIKEMQEVPLENYLSVWQKEVTEEGKENTEAGAKLTLLRSEVMSNPLFPVHRMVEVGGENVMDEIRKEIQRYQDLKKISTAEKAQRLLATMYQLRNELLMERITRGEEELSPKQKTSEEELKKLGSSGIEPYQEQELKDMILGLIEETLRSRVAATPERT